MGLDDFRACGSVFVLRNVSHLNLGKIKRQGFQRYVAAIALYPVMGEEDVIHLVDEILVRMFAGLPHRERRVRL